jgi:hypothetical protein
MDLHEILKIKDPGNVKVSYKNKSEIIGIAVIQLLARIPKEGVDISNPNAIVLSGIFNHPGELQWLIGYPSKSYESKERILVEKGFVREIKLGVYQRTEKANKSDYTPLIFKNYLEWAMK